MAKFVTFISIEERRSGYWMIAVWVAIIILVFKDEEMNTQRVTCPWWHIWFISEPGYESLSSLSRFSTHFTVQLQPPSAEMWNGSFFTMILFPQNCYSITNINKNFWTSQCSKYVTSTIILVLDFLSLPFCDVLKFWH